MLDAWKDLPKVEPPPPLKNDEKLTVAEVENLVAYEGLGYCIFTYISSGKIEDGELAILWEHAKQSMIAVVDYLSKLQGQKRQKPIEAIENLDEL